MNNDGLQATLWDMWPYEKTLLADAIEAWLTRDAEQQVEDDPRAWVT